MPSDEPKYLPRVRELLDQSRAAVAVAQVWVRHAPRRAKVWARKNWVSIWLVPQTIVAVSLFFHGAGTIQSATVLSELAVVEGDHGSRRERGEFAFKPAFAGDAERDWDGLASNASAALPFRMGGTQYDLEPGSVVVFRAPFRGSRNLEDQMRILKGKVTTPDHREVKQSQTEDQVREIPKLTANREKLDRTKIYPRIDSHLVVNKPGQAKIAFSWSHPQTGFVALLSVESDQVRYIPIDETDHVHASIQTDRSYAWQIVSPDRQVLEGPFRFQIASGGQETWRRILTDPGIRKDRGGVDILLDQ